jgi:hypothetical protein
LILPVDFFIRNIQTIKTLPDNTLNKGGFSGIFLIGFYLILKLSQFIIVVDKSHQLCVNIVYLLAIGFYIIEVNNDFQ